jgi:hypothetical protein
MHFEHHWNCLKLDDLYFSDQDSVRLLAVEGCAALGKLLEPQDCAAHILPVIVNFSQVRCSHFASIQDCNKFVYIAWICYRKTHL